MELGLQISGGIKAEMEGRSFHLWCVRPVESQSRAWGEALSSEELARGESGQKPWGLGLLAVGTFVSQSGGDLASAGGGAGADLQKRSWGQSCREGALWDSQA